MNAKNVLLIDDEPEILELMNDFFVNAGWTVFGAKNGLEALKSIDDKKPSLIISDINMPDMDGLELLEKLFGRGLNTPVILITGFRDAKKMQRAWEACVYDFLDKPVDYDHLLLVAENALKFGEEYVIAARRRFQRIRNPKIAVGS